MVKVFSVPLLHGRGLNLPPAFYSLISRRRLLRTLRATEAV